MREELKLLLTDKGNRYALFLSLGILLVGLIFYLVKLGQLPPLLPIFYNRPWGMPQLGSSFSLLFLLLFALFVVMINLTCAINLRKTIILLSRTLLWVSVLISLLTATAIIHIILLIT